MFKKLFFAILVVFFIAGTSFAGSAGYSGPITSDRTFHSPVQISGLVVLADGSNEATVTIYDGVTGSGTDTAVVTFTVTAGQYVNGFTLPLPIDLQKGMVVDVGTNTTCYVFGAKGISPDAN